jgi:uncharacterized membrane protein YfcA
VLYSGRLVDKSQLRAAVAVTISVSVILRLFVYAFSGLFFQPGLLPLAALLSVFMVAGLAIGTRLHTRISRENLLRLISILLVINGFGLLIRAFW